MSEHQDELDHPTRQDLARVRVGDAIDGRIHWQSASQSGSLTRVFGRLMQEDIALQPHNGRDALRDAYEESLDLVCYLRQAIEERDHPA